MKNSYEKTETEEDQQQHRVRRKECEEKVEVICDNENKIFQLSR